MNESTLVENIYIFFILKLIFFGVFKLFWWVDVKNNFKKTKNILFSYISKRKYFKKQSQSYPKASLYTN
jgi:hypothetical protein